MLLMLLGAGLLIGGLLVFLNSKHKEAGICCFASGGLFLILPMTLALESGKELLGYLLFLGSYFFLAPVWSAYKTYQQYRQQSYLEDEEIAVKEKALSRIWVFVLCFIFGALSGFFMICQALAV
ncbi:MAG: hypothetical protein E7443_00550 [Ruminococcaceae bacterium]|nr:hypothetical protein [Oscillospiraceae bacterium]